MGNRKSDSKESQGSTVVFYSGFAGPVQAEPEHSLAQGANIMLSFWRSWDVKNSAVRPEDRVSIAAGRPPRAKEK